MQTIFLFEPTGSLSSLGEALRMHFGPVGERRRLDPVSQFVRSFIGSRTYDETSWGAFARLCRRFRDWNALADAPEGDIEAALGNVTFSEKKAPELKRALQKIRVRAGTLELEFLEDVEVEQALFWLQQIHGVGPKIAAAVLNFSTLRKRAFVVETHVLRVLRRFGFVGPAARIEEAYAAVMAAADGFDADDLYDLHCHLKQLGQTVCGDRYAACEACPLAQDCMKRIEKSAA